MEAASEFMLSDPNIVPDEDLITSLISEKKNIWYSIINYSTATYKGSEPVWNYYKDGKQWLFRVLYRKKTIFWAAILKNDFRVTFYFGDKAEPAIMEADLPESIKNDFLTGKRFGKIRAISMLASETADVSLLCRIIDLKVKTG
jgi:hypothetical protein